MFCFIFYRTVQTVVHWRRWKKNSKLFCTLLWYKTYQNPSSSLSLQRAINLPFWWFITLDSVNCFYTGASEIFFRYFFQVFKVSVPFFDTKTPQKNYSEYFSIATGARKYRNTTFLLFNLHENFRLIWRQNVMWWKCRCKISIFSSLFRQRTVKIDRYILIFVVFDCKRPGFRRFYSPRKDAVWQTGRREPVF